MAACRAAGTMCPSRLHETRHAPVFPDGPPLVLALPAFASADAPVRKPSSRTLLQTQGAWDGSPYPAWPTGQPQITMLRVEIAPHSTLPWHVHPMPSSGYVLQGELTIEDRDSGKRRRFIAGQAFTETVDTVHRGHTGAGTTVLLLTYMGTPGQAISIPAAGERPEF